MAETLHEMAVRMVGDRCMLGCAGCPAKALWDKKDICLIRLVLKAENCEEQIDGLKAWAKEHPAPRYPSWDDGWKSLFQNAVCAPCPSHFFGEKCQEGMKCPECRKRQMSKKVAEKLGIKPITTAKAVPAHDGCEGCRWMDKHEDEEPCKNCCGVMGGSAPDLWEER